MLVSILIGLAIVAVVVIVAYLATHHKAAASPTPAGADLASTVANAAAESWAALKRDLPEIVSMELAQARSDLAAALEQARTAEQTLAATITAHEADKAAVAARVSAAVTASPELAPVAAE